MKMITDLPAHISKRGPKEYVGYFFIEGQMYQYGTDASPTHLKERMRAQGFTKFIDEYLGQKKEKIMPRKIVVKKFVEKPKVRQQGKWYTEGPNMIYNLGQYKAEVGEVDLGGWQLTVIGTGVYLATYGKEGLPRHKMPPGKKFMGWATMPEACEFAVDLIDRLHAEYVTQPPNDFETGDFVEATATNWNFDEGHLLIIEDVNTGTGEIGGARSYKSYYAEGRWHRNIDVREMGKS